MRKTTGVVRRFGIARRHAAGLPTAATELGAREHRTLGLSAITHDGVENPLSVVPKAEGIGLYLFLLRDATLVGRTQQMTNLMGGGGIGAIGVSRGFINGQPLHDRHISIAIWHAILHPYRGNPAGIVILGNVLAQRDHQIRVIKSAVTFDIGKRCLRLEHLIEHIFL